MVSEQKMALTRVAMHVANCLSDVWRMGACYELWSNMVVWPEKQIEFKWWTIGALW